MEPFEEENLNGDDQHQVREPQPPRWMAAGMVALLGIAGIAASYGVHEHNQVRQLTGQAATTNQTMSQLQSQVDALNAKLNGSPAGQPADTARAGAPVLPPPAKTADAAESPAPPEVASAPPTAPALAVAPTAKPAPPKNAAAKRKPVVDKRYVELKAKLDDQQKQLKETQDEVAKNRADLEGSISSTRDQLNGSIAKTHDELVLLEKRGERAYYEFDLSKSKEFQRVGPMSISLRKTDTKHKNYDLAMLVDDNELSKKKINLYEPVWIHLEAGGQPVQVVVNRIEKTTVHGYVSAPKYKQSELATLNPSNPSSASPAPTNNTQQAPPSPQQ
jgi:uncharacterized coiled-coil protein SlyX